MDIWHIRPGGLTTMPNFPSFRLFLAVIAASVALQWPSASASAQTPPPAPDASIDALAASASELRAAIVATELEVTSLRLRLAAGRMELEAARSARLVAMAEYDAATSELAVARKDIRRLAAVLYVRGTKSLNVVLDAESMADAMRKKQLADTAVDVQTDIVAELDKAERKAREAREKAEVALAAAESAVAQLDAQQRALDAQLLERRALLDGVGERLEHKLAESAAVASLDPALASRLAEQEGELAAIVARAGGGGASPARVAPPQTTAVRGIRIAVSIAPQLEQLLAAASAAGVSLGGGGFRDPMVQIALRLQNCGSTEFDVFDKPASECSPPTARPGTSMHEQGLAIDFTSGASAITSETEPAFVWLSANAPGFGFLNLPGEPWHWSTTGR